jgi:acyl carrier protein
MSREFERSSYSELIGGIASNLSEPGQVHAELARQAAPASPPFLTSATVRPKVAPTTWIEKRIFQIWSELLMLRDFGVDDEFLELGGHSLVGIQVLSRIQDEFGISLPFAIMFEESLTVRTLSEAVEATLTERIGQDTEAARAELRSMTDEQIQDLLSTS